MKKSVWIFLLAVFLPGAVLGWLALRGVEEQQIVFERRTAELYQKETEALAAAVRDAVEEERRAFGDAVHRLLARNDPQALAEDFSNSLADVWPRKAIGFALSKDSIMLSPTTKAAAANPAWRDFIWNNGPWLCNAQPAVIYRVPIEVNRWNGGNNLAVNNGTSRYAAPRNLREPERDNQSLANATVGRTEVTDAQEKAQGAMANSATELKSDGAVQIEAAQGAAKPVDGGLVLKQEIAPAPTMPQAAAESPSKPRPERAAIDLSVSGKTATILSTENERIGGSISGQRSAAEGVALPKPAPMVPPAPVSPAAPEPVNEPAPAPMAGEQHLAGGADERRVSEDKDVKERPADKLDVAKKSLAGGRAPDRADAASLIKAKANEAKPQKLAENLAEDRARGLEFGAKGTPEEGPAVAHYYSDFSYQYRRFVPQGNGGDGNEGREPRRDTGNLWGWPAYGRGWNLGKDDYLLTRDFGWQGTPMLGLALSGGQMQGAPADQWALRDVGAGGNGLQAPAPAGATASASFSKPEATPAPASPIAAPAPMPMAPVTAASSVPPTADAAVSGARAKSPSVQPSSLGVSQESLKSKTEADSMRRLAEAKDKAKPEAGGAPGAAGNASSGGVLMATGRDREATAAASPLNGPDAETQGKQVLGRSQTLQDLKLEGGAEKGFAVVAKVGTATGQTKDNGSVTFLEKNLGGGSTLRLGPKMAQVPMPAPQKPGSVPASKTTPPLVDAPQGGARSEPLEVPKILPSANPERPMEGATSVANDPIAAAPGVPAKGVQTEAKLAYQTGVDNALPRQGALEAVKLSTDNEEQSRVLKRQIVPQVQVPSQSQMEQQAQQAWSPLVDSATCTPTVRNVAPQQVLNAPSQAVSSLIPDTAAFRTITGMSDEGMVSRFVQDKLEIIFWVRPPEDRSMVFGCLLEVANFGEIWPALLSQHQDLGDGNKPRYVVALLDDKAKPVASLPQNAGLREWKRPFVASEIGEALPHWEAALYLASPEALAESASGLRRTLSFTVAAALSLILLGAWLVVADIRRQLALAQQKTDFVSNVSHELKTPLTSIRMFAELMHDRPQAPEKQGQYLRIITVEAERLTRLINNVLDFAKLERRQKRFDKRALDLHGVIARVWDCHEMHLRDAGFTTRWEAAPPPYPVVGDEDALSQVLVNLLSNAEKYSPERKEVELHTWTDNGSLFLSVLDRGMGVPEGEERKIFESFYRAHDSLSSGIQGSGLGLTLAQRLAEEHGGRIEFERREGGGSRFTLRVPLAHKEEA